MTEQRAGGISDATVLAVIASMVAIVAFLWLWGGIAGTVFGGGWPGLGADRLLSVLVRLPGHLDDPARAWPGVRLAVAGTRGVLRGVVPPDLDRRDGRVALSRAGVLVTARRRGSGARWARPGDLRSLRGGDRGARLTLGRRRGHLLHAEEHHALVAFGPPQSGKSAGLAVPALLEWDGPAVASSIKTDLLAATARRRRSLGRVFVFDPFELAGTSSDTWSPLHAARTWDGALEVAWRLAAAGQLDQRSVEGGDFWAIAAEQRLAPLLYAASATGARIDSVVRWAYGQGTRELDQALAQLAGSAQDDGELADAHAAYDSVRAFEAQAAGRALRSRRPRRRCCGLTASHASRARHSRARSLPTACWMRPPRFTWSATPGVQATAPDLPGTAFGNRSTALRARQRSPAGASSCPLLLCLDEAGNIAAYNLAEIASTAPSHNIQLVSIFHDLAQARSRYRQQVETVVNSRRAPMLLTSVADLETLRYFAGLIGEGGGAGIDQPRPAPVARRAPTASRRRPLVAPEALRQLPGGQRAAAVRTDPANRAAAAHVVRRPAPADTGRSRSAWSEPDDPDGDDPGDGGADELDGARWPLNWIGLYARKHWM